MKRIALGWVAALLLGRAWAAELPEVTESAQEELGTTYGVPQMNGFVFIEGRYLSPPYTVTRKGNGIFINRVLVEQPVAWSHVAPAAAEEGEPAAAAGQPPAAPKAVDADGDFEEVAEPAAAPAPEAPAAPADAAEPAKPKAVKSIDDLFNDEQPPAAAPAPAAPEAAGAVAPAPPAVAVRTPEELKQEKAALVASLDRLRKGYEQALSQGEIFFFGQRHNRVNGNYGTGRTVMGVLPKALRQAQSPQDLLQRLNQGGVYFLDLGICSALYKNKTTFRMLEERFAKIEEAEAAEAKRRKAATAW